MLLSPIPQYNVPVIAFRILVIVNNVKSNSFMCIYRALIFIVDFSDCKIIFAAKMFSVFCITFVKNPLSAIGLSNTNLSYHNVLIFGYFFIVIHYIIKDIEHWY